MGSLNNGVLEITNCYAVNYEFVDNVLVFCWNCGILYQNQEGVSFNETMKQLYSTANKSEVILGWQDGFVSVHTQVLND